MSKNINLFKSYLQSTDWQVKENANQTHSLQGLNNYLANELTKEYWLTEIYPSEIAEAHKNGDLHIHDLGQLSSYCCGWDLQDLLRTGFKGVSGKTESAPAKHFSSALGQIVNFIYTLQGEVAGAQAFSSFDTLLAPFIYYDKLDYSQVKQAMQEFIYNMNVPTRVGFQTPFSNITLDLKCPKHMASEPAIVGGELADKTYGEFQAEMDLINRAFAEVMCEGDAKGRIFTFPIPTYSLTKDFDWDRPGLEPVWEMTSKYGIPNWANYINSDMNPEDARSMCPLHGDTQVLVRSERGVTVRSIKDIYYTSKSKNTKYSTLFNGTWTESGVISVSSTGYIEIVTQTGQKTVFERRHLQPILRDGRELTVEAQEIKESDWLLFNSKPITEKGSYEAGFAVGAYIGDGSRSEKHIVYSLSDTEKKKSVLDKLVDFYSFCGYKTVVKKSDTDKLVTLRVLGDSTSFIDQFVNTGHAKDKNIKDSVYNRGSEFLQGMLDGWYLTDGGNRNRIYTTSEQLKNSFQTICTLLGYWTNIENTDTRSNRLSDSPVYTLKFSNRDQYQNVVQKTELGYYIPINTIQVINDNNQAYCFTVPTENHLFTLANGLITHNCRLRLDNRMLRKRGGGLFGSNPLTGSIGVVTLNLPRLGYLAQSITDFYELLAEQMNLAKHSLEIKREAVEQFTEQGLYPYTKFYMRTVHQRFGKYWNNHFSTIGLVGMNEALLNLIGENIATPQGQQLAKEILSFMREKITEYQEETGNLYNLEATPAESTAYRLAKLDFEYYSDIQFANDTQVKHFQATPYYTNSSQLPVGYSQDIFDALDLQDDIQAQYTGGTMFHGFLGESMPDIQATKKLVKTIAEQYSLPYFTITPTFSICPVHGYLKGESKYCHLCAAEGKTQETEVYSRIVGYLRPVNQWNQGKQVEFADRQVYKITNK